MDQKKIWLLWKSARIRCHSSFPYGKISPQLFWGHLSCNFAIIEMLRYKATFLLTGLGISAAEEVHFLPGGKGCAWPLPRSTHSRQGTSVLGWGKPALCQHLLRFCIIYPLANLKCIVFRVGSPQKIPCTFVTLKKCTFFSTEDKVLGLSSLDFIFMQPINLTKSTGPQVLSPRQHASHETLWLESQPQEIKRLKLKLAERERETEGESSMRLPTAYMTCSVSPQWPEKTGDPISYKGLIYSLNQACGKCPNQMP